MKLFKNYLFSQLSQSFFPIFITLFFITSIVYLVKIASLTSIIKIDFLELMQIYSYSLANILFLTLPISIFAATIIALSKLSSEYELIIFTSFGLKPFHIIKTLFPMISMISITLSIISLDLIPKSDYLNSKFLSFKQAQAQFNIKASEYGQSFGNWSIYLDNSSQNFYNNIKLFTTSDGVDQFIIAKNADIYNNANNMNLQLQNGKTVIIKEQEINQVNFNKMNLYYPINIKHYYNFKTSYDYWSLQSDRIDEKFSFYILISLFPVLSIYFFITLSYFNPRFDRNKGAVFTILCVITYYGFSFYLSKSIGLYSLAVLPTGWILVSYLLYHKKIKPLY